MAELRTNQEVLYITTPLHAVFETGLGLSASVLENQRGPSLGQLSTVSSICLRHFQSDCTMEECVLVCNIWPCK